SQYAYRLYEILKQYQVTGRRVIEIKELRWILNIENSYKQWNDLKRKVLDIAEREINEHTDLKISWKPIKTGRKITALDFKIRTNPKNKTSPENDTKNNERIEDLQGLLKLVPEKYKSLKTIYDAIQSNLKKYGIDYVERNISYANKHAKKNYRAYLIKALKEDWGIQGQEDEKLINQTKKEHSEKIKKQQTEIQKEHEQENKISELKKSIPDEQIEKHIGKYLEDYPSFKDSYEKMLKRNKQNAFNVIKRQIIMEYFI
ncbi:MAG: replication initiation protein, partial [Candidatus Muiribacteriota bacterium]